MNVKDNGGQNFDGSKSYRLTVSANAPVNQYWSATVYDRATHSLIRDMSRSGRGSQSPGLQKNPDGLVDIYFGPKAPAGKDSNWVPTQADNLKCSSASTAPKSLCSTKRGSCRTSSGSLLSKRGGRRHERSSRSNLRRLAARRGQQRRNANAAEAEYVVRDHWRIERLAHELMSRKELTSAAEILDIIEGRPAGIA